MIGDSTAAGSSGTALRDLLRHLDRNATGSHPARPTTPPPSGFARMALAAPVEQTALSVGDWTFTQDPDTGDLIVTNSETGAATTVARKAGP